MFASPDAIIQMATNWKMAEERAEKLKAQNSALEVEKKALTGDALRWENPSVLNALIRRLAGQGYGRRFEMAWNDFYKELLYKHHINLKLRCTNWVDKNPGKKPPAKYKFLTEDEIGDAVATAVALCEEKGITTADILQNAMQEVKSNETEVSKDAHC